MNNSIFANDAQANLKDIKEYLQQPEFSPFFAKINKNQEQFLSSLNQAIKKLNSFDGIISNGKDESIDIILNRWKSFVPSKEDCNTKHSEQKFKELYSCTRSFVNSVNSLPKQSKITRTRLSKQIGEDLQNLETLRRSIQQQMEREQKTAEPNSEIKQLQRSLKEIETQIVKMRKEKEDAQKESQIEKNWDEKIQQAFKALKECTYTIENEKNIANQEYQRMINFIYVLSVAVIFWFFSIYKAIFITHLYFSGWMSFLPYYLPIPLFFVVFWVLIVQKNRASKIEISLANELYHIRYMEGLLLAINKLSANSDSSISRINKALDVMIEGYMHQVEHLGIDEKNVEEIEKKEMNSNKYMQIIDKLIEKI